MQISIHLVPPGPGERGKRGLFENKKKTREGKKTQIAGKCRRVSDSGGFCERAPAARRQGNIWRARCARVGGARAGTPCSGRNARQSPRHRPRERPPRPANAPRTSATRSRSARNQRRTHPALHTCESPQRRFRPRDHSAAPLPPAAAAAAAGRHRD
ncbi:unnamed protein product, partial [Iphiclides podalirius]